MTGDSREYECLAQLERLLAECDVSRWVFTQDVAIQVGVIPYSHPVLTLNTRHLRQDDLLLATFLHEQIHWFAESRGDSLHNALTELEGLYPSVPVGFPEGARDRHSTYLHLVVNWLEFDALRMVIGLDRALAVIEHWCSDHYTWIFQQVRDNDTALGDLVQRHSLVV